MDSIGIFSDINLKKSNDLMDVFEEALGKTNNLMETMENFNNHKLKNKNIINNEQEKRNINNDIKLKKVGKFKTYNQSQFNSIKYFKKREPYNYQKEYEKDLINQIEELFNPNYKNDPKQNIGMLSLLSPLINSNVKDKNKQLYKSKERINDRQLNLYDKKNINNKSRKSYNYSMKKLDNKEQIKMKEKKLLNEEKFKIDQQVIKEVNRPINKAKTNAIKEIYFKDNKKENKSNVDLLINKLKKKYK